MRRHRRMNSLTALTGATSWRRRWDVLVSRRCASSSSVTDRFSRQLPLEQAANEGRETTRRTADDRRVCRGLRFAMHCFVMLTAHQRRLRIPMDRAIRQMVAAPWLAEPARLGRCRCPCGDILAIESADTISASLPCAKLDAELVLPNRCGSGKTRRCRMELGSMGRTVSISIWHVFLGRPSPLRAVPFTMLPGELSTHPLAPRTHRQPALRGSARHPKAKGAAGPGVRVDFPGPAVYDNADQPQRIALWSHKYAFNHLAASVESCSSYGRICARFLTKPKTSAHCADSL